MAVDQQLFRQTLGHFASGMTIAASTVGGSPVGFTCQSFMSLSLDPPLVGLATALTSTTWPQIAASGSFCVNVLAEDQEELCRRCAVSGADKFAGVVWRPSPVSGSPIIEGCLAWVDCRVESVHGVGDHELVVGRVLDQGNTGGCPLLFYRSHFVRLAPEDGAT